jgi:hypothetical protein
VLVSLPNGRITVWELTPLSTGSYSVVLASNPVVPVHVAIGGEGVGVYINVQPPTFTFTTSNWNVPVTVTVGSIPLLACD